MISTRVQLFGGLRLYRGPDLLPALPSERSKSILAFLALNRGRVELIDVLRDRFDVARREIEDDLSHIRQVIEPASSLSIEPDAVSFDTRAHWLDVHEFEAALDRAGPDDSTQPSEEQAAHLRAAVELYRGDLLEGMWDEWCLFERERLRLRYLDALERLMRHHEARGEWVQAAFRARGLLAHDPLREHVHRALMRFHAHAGDPAAALRQFDRCSRLLRRELDLPPAPETLALRDEIRASLPRPARPSPLHALAAERESLAAPA